LDGAKRPIGGQVPRDFRTGEQVMAALTNGRAKSKYAGAV